MTKRPAHTLTSRKVSIRQCALALILLVVFFAGAAHAQQEVTVSDQKVISNTSEIKGNTENIKKQTENISNQIGGSTSGKDDTVNDHLKNIETFTKSPASALSTVSKPDVDLDTITPSADSGSCGGRATLQQQNCKDIISTKNAKFAYMKAMYDMAAKRQTTLNDLQTARHNLETKDFGKLQDNTNQILTLIAQIQIDRQRMESVYNAYSSRIEYLQNRQTQLAKVATAPSSNSVVGNVVSEIFAGFVLKEALNIQSNGGRKPLSIEGSNGW